MASSSVLVGGGVAEPLDRSYPINEPDGVNFLGALESPGSAKGQGERDNFTTELA